MPRVADELGSWQWAFLVLAIGPFSGAAAMLALRLLPDQSENGRWEAVTKKILCQAPTMLELICRPGSTLMPTRSRKVFG